MLPYYAVDHQVNQWIHLVTFWIAMIYFGSGLCICDFQSKLPPPNISHLLNLNLSDRFMSCPAHLSITNISLNKQSFSSSRSPFALCPTSHLSNNELWFPGLTKRNTCTLYVGSLIWVSFNNSLLQNGIFCVCSVAFVETKNISNAMNVIYFYPRANAKRLHPHDSGILHIVREHKEPHLPRQSVCVFHARYSKMSNFSLVQLSRYELEPVRGGSKKHSLILVWLLLQSLLK